MKLKTWLEKHDDDDFGSRELARLMNGRPDSTTASELWASITNGDATTTEALAWVQCVARNVVANVDVVEKASSERERAALQAIGFSGPVDPYYKAKEFMQVLA